MCVPIEIDFLKFENLDRCSVIMSYDCPCNMKGIDIVHIKMFDGMIHELKEVRYVPQVKKKILSLLVP